MTGAGGSGGIYNSTYSNTGCPQASPGNLTSIDFIGTGGGGGFGGTTGGGSPGANGGGGTSVGLGGFPGGGGGGGAPGLIIVEW